MKMHIIRLVGRRLHGIKRVNRACGIEGVHGLLKAKVAVGPNRVDRAIGASEKAVRVANPLAAVPWGAHSHLDRAAVRRLPVALKKMLADPIIGYYLSLHLLLVKIRLGADVGGRRTLLNKLFEVYGLIIVAVKPFIKIVGVVDRDVR